MPFKERTIVDEREQMALLALDPRYSVTEVADRFGVTRPTVRLWRDRYRESGRAGLADRTHATRTCPHRTSAEIEELIVGQRAKWGWGSKKILQRLEDQYPDLVLPKRATVDAILSRRGLVQRQPKRRRRMQGPFARRYEASEPGELMTMDHKAPFRLRNGQVCYALTIADSASRFLYACRAMSSTAFEPNWRAVERVLRDWGLPRAVLTDNGPPFGPTHGRISTMAVHLMMLGIQPVFSRPGKPVDNARHERMHRDLGVETRRPAKNMAAQQRNFNHFATVFNQERPHEGIAMRRPAELCKASPRPFPRSAPKPDYPRHFEIRKVAKNGTISWRHDAIFLSEALAGRQVALEATDEGIWTIHFYAFTIGKLDETTKEFI